MARSTGSVSSNSRLPSTSTGLAPDRQFAQERNRAARGPLRVAVIPGDGIGPEVLAQGLRVLGRITALHGLALERTEFDWGSAYYRRTGRMMPDDALEVLRGFDAVYFGAVGSPEVPDHIAVGGLILAIRRGLDLFVNLRPVRLFPGVASPVRTVTGQVDFVFVRENTEGEYLGEGEWTGRGSPEERVVQHSLFTRRGIERIVRYAFALAQTRRRRLTSVTKSNALVPAMLLWDQVVGEVGREFPDVTLESTHVDAAAYRLVRHPDHFDVLVGSNLFGDILTDLGAGLQGSLGLAASASLHPGASTPPVFEPVHGSAPDIAGRGIANPIGAVWSAAMLLEYLGAGKAAAAVMRAIERVLAEGVHTPDLGGTARTTEVGDALVEALEATPAPAHTS